jgi:hypothetical protein
MQGLKGLIYSYNKEKGIGAIRCGQDRFWFHRDRIKKGPIDPKIDDEVIFEVSTTPVAPGRLPIATAIIVLEKDAAGTPDGQSTLGVK